MGSTIMGGQGTQDLLRPEQLQFLQSSLGPGGPYSQFLQPQDQQSMQAAFQKGVVDPSMQQFNQQVVPAIQQRFVDAEAGTSSALNQALAGSAENLQTSLASQYLPFMQGQQQNTLQALGQMGGLASQQTFQPYQQQGLMGPLIQGAAQLGAGYLSGGASYLPQLLKLLQGMQ